MTVNDSRARELINAPRGRRVCIEVACLALEELGTQLFYAEHDSELVEKYGGETAVPDFLELLAGFPADAMRTVAADDLILALEQTTSAGMYWQPPDERDVFLALPAVRELLLPLAEALLENPGVDEWVSAVALDRQAAVSWRIYTGEWPLKLTGVLSGVQLWRKRMTRQERESAERSIRFPAIWSGDWWSTPVPSGSPETTAVRAEGPNGLRLVEDGTGDRQAQVQRLAVVRAPRVFEVDGAEAWAGLVARYPLDVTQSRHSDWLRATDCEGPWLMPDWLAVAADFDAVHVSIWGHLVTAGAALPVPGTESYTMLAGWGPDATFWFGDVLEPVGDLELWEKSDEGGWSRIS